jgi:hypothetical protein
MDDRRQQRPLLLTDLPAPILSEIAKQTIPRRPYPLLKVNRALRDAVLSGLGKISLVGLQGQQSAAFDYQPLARLLNRACSLVAPRSLDVQLTLGDHREALPALLQPALDTGGWKNVCKLQV